MKKLYTAAEIAQMRLSGLPTTKSSILARAAKESWSYEEQYGIGGVRKVFEIPDRYLLTDRRIKPSVMSARQNLEKYLVGDAGAQDEHTVNLDESKLALSARIMEEWIEEEKLVLSHKRKGNLIALLYKIVSRNADPEDLLKLMSGAVSAARLPVEGQSEQSEDNPDEGGPEQK